MSGLGSGRGLISQGYRFKATDYGWGASHLCKFAPLTPQPLLPEGEGEPDFKVPLPQGEGFRVRVTQLGCTLMDV